jgi:hypothetical protein
VTSAEPRSYRDFAAAVVDVLDQAKVSYAVAGSFASSVYGEPRTTLDVDLTVHLTSEGLELLATAARERLLSLDVQSARKRLRAVKPQPFQIIDGHGGWKADCYVLTQTPYELGAFERRRSVRFSSASSGLLWLYAPEDVILMKLHYYRLSDGVSTKHLRDVGGMLTQMSAAGSHFDRDYIERWAKSLDVAGVWADLWGAWRERQS